MKKKIAVILALSLTLSVFAGCGDKKDAADNETTAVQDTVAEESNSQTDEADSIKSSVPIVDKEVDVMESVSFRTDYKGIELSLPRQAEVTDEDVNTIAVQTYAQMGAKSNSKKTVVEDGDIVNIDFIGKKDGVAFDGGTAESYTLEIGSGSFIDGFEDGLIGVNVGETTDLNLTFPEDYGNTDLAGQDVVFTVTVNYIYPSCKEEMIDDEIAVITEGEYSNVEGFYQFCREYLEASAKYNYTVNKENAVIAKLDAIADVKEISQATVDKYTDQLTESLEKQAASYGVDLDTFCYYNTGMDSAAYISQSAQTRARWGMIFDYIAQKEGLSVDDAQLDEKMKEMADENRYESVEEMLGERDKEEFRESFLYEKVVDFIYDNAKVTEY